jgi:hypothetical protein
MILGLDSRTRRVVALVRSMVAAQCSCTSDALRAISSNSASGTHDDGESCSTPDKPSSASSASSACYPPSPSRASCLPGLPQAHRARGRVHPHTQPACHARRWTFRGRRCEPKGASARPMSSCISLWRRWSARAAFSMISAWVRASRA